MRGLIGEQGSLLGVLSYEEGLVPTGLVLSLLFFIVFVASISGYLPLWVGC